MQLTAIGNARNGGIALNYRSVAAPGQIRRNFTAVLLDGLTNKIRVLRYTDAAAFVEEHTIDFVISSNTWYALSVTPVMNTAESATLNITAVDLLTGATVNGTATVANYGAPTGGQGLITQQAYTYFNSFDIA
jgi:hypothetical protein